MLKLRIHVIFFWFAILFGPAMAQPQIFEHPLSPRIANYEIHVKLDTATRMLDGKQVLTWHNKTGVTIRDLHFHLYLNGFRNNQTTFMLESGGRHRGHNIGKEGWGYIDVDRIQIKDGEDLTRFIEFIQPDDGNEFDKTVFRVPMLIPLKPRESIQLEIDFTAKLPTPPFARTGAKDEFFMVGQWFPKIGVFENGEWNCHQFHYNTEFFADFGVYDVWMTVPAGNSVGATGVEVEITQNDDNTATHYYHAEDVHDFAWTTSPDFVEFTDSEQDVEIRLLMQKSHVEQADRHMNAAKLAIGYFQDWYGDYPFPNLTIVDPRHGAGGAGGMEYPTLVTTISSYDPSTKVREIERAIIHEFGHNYWYHLLASNEFEESWLDEGINTFTEIQIMDDFYGKGSYLNFRDVKIQVKSAQRAFYLRFKDFDETVKNGWDYYSTISYAANSYAKPGIFLETLQNYLGKDTMRDIMRTYVEKWRFKHPKSQDFIDVANEVSGADLNWFFDQALYTNHVLDYAVADISSKKKQHPRGFDFENQMADSTNGTTLYQNSVKIRRLGEFTFPVELMVVFSDGDTLMEDWHGQDLWKEFTYLRSAKVISAQIDPYNKIALDANLTNNSRSVEKHTRVLNAMTSKVHFWSQFLFDAPESLFYLLPRLSQ